MVRISNLVKNNRSTLIRINKRFRLLQTPPQKAVCLNSSIITVKKTFSTAVSLIPQEFLFVRLMIRKINPSRFLFATTVNFGSIIFTVGPLSQLLLFCSLRLGNTQIIVSLDAISMDFLQPTVPSLTWCRFDIIDKKTFYARECSEVVRLIKKQYGDSDSAFFGVVKKFLGPVRRKQGSSEYGL
jgi:hypothetical protein